MSLKDTANTMIRMLETCIKDLHKASGGNKAAAQRVRTGSIKLAKIAKQYRKESISSERKGSPKKVAKAKTAPKKAGKAKKGKKK